MSDDRPWYREPESFIALAALIVSLSAVVVGIYEASLQRTHDRAEVWPHVELSTYTSPQSVSVGVENTGIGPAIIHYTVVSVDGKPAANWHDVLKASLGDAPAQFNTSTVADRSMRAGDKSTLIELPTSVLRPGFLRQAARISIALCYSSVFGDSWMMTGHLGDRAVSTSVHTCPAQPSNVDF
ncbi:MAG: hypothetical protein ABI442_07780 [Gemmatimonadaceae bacterium]